MWLLEKLTRHAWSVFVAHIIPLLDHAALDLQLYHFALLSKGKSLYYSHLWETVIFSHCKIYVLFVCKEIEA